MSKKAIAQFCRRHRVKRLSLFGSILGKEYNPESDVDLLVEFEPDSVPSFFTISEMEREMSKLLPGRKVELPRLVEKLKKF